MSTQEKTKVPEQGYQYQRPESIKMWRADVYEALSDADMPDMAERWLSCSDHPLTKISPKPGAALPDSAKMVLVCTGDHTHDAEIVAQTCDLRICPDCARRHAARLAARYTPKMLELLHTHHRTFRFRLVTFTLPYRLDDPDIRKKYLRGFKQVERVMDEMMSTEAEIESDTARSWKKEQGYIVASEFGSEGYKLHYHAIHWGKYLDQGELTRRWFTATDGEAQIVDVRALFLKGESLEKNVKEVFKYAVKFYSKDKITREVVCIPAQLLPALANCLQKTRRVRAYGVFFKIPEPKSETHKCETCDSPMVGIPVGYFVTYCNTGMLPKELWLATKDAELLLKPADKSPPQSTASPPESPVDIRKRQIEMDVIKKMRWQAKDEY